MSRIDPIVSNHIDHLRYFHSHSGVNLIPDGNDPPARMTDTQYTAPTSPCHRCGVQTYWDPDIGRLIHCDSGDFNCPPGRITRTNSA